MYAAAQNSLLTTGLESGNARYRFGGHFKDMLGFREISENFLDAEGQMVC
jgi:hypothetical protein